VDTTLSPKLPPQNLKLYLNAIYQRCYRLLGEQEWAKDATQEVFARFYETKQTIQKPFHYLYRMSTNHCISELRTKSRTLTVPLEAPDTQSATHIANPVANLTVEWLLNEFGQEAATLLFHRHLDGMTLQELGTLYNCSHQNIDKRLRKLHSEIQAYLAE
jgi:RNA polymerase sigma factor (sigma-70 family)